VKGVPSLPVNNNKFACLNVEEMEELEQVDTKVTPIQNPREKVLRLRKWEYKLPKVYKIAASPSSKSLRIPVQIQTMDTGETHGLEGLVDCGADGEFLSTEFVKRNNIQTRKLTRPIPVNNVDGSPNEHGPISEVADLVLQYKGHTQ